jgi:hypothetical protein
MGFLTLNRRRGGRTRYRNHGQKSSRDPFSIKLSFEPLEDRRLLTLLSSEFSPILATSSDAVDAEYLLITSSALEQAFQPLVDRRTAQGKPGMLITVESIAASYPGTRPDGGTDLQTKIHDCIADYKANHGTVWVTFGGDETVVPIRYCYGEHTIADLPADLYYFDVDSTWDTNADGKYGVQGQDTIDLIPEVWGGRIPIRTAQQATDYINKLIRYEDASPEGYANTMLLDGCTCGPGYDSGTDRSVNYQDHERVSGGEKLIVNLYRNYIQPYWQATPLDKLCDSITSWDTSLCGDYAANGAHLQEQLNRGYQYFLLYGHGTSGGFSQEGSFTTVNATALTNADRPTIVFALSCNTAAYDKAEPSLSEAFLRNPNGGAVAYIGANSVTYANYIIYAQQFFKEVFGNKRNTIGEAFSLMKSSLTLNDWYFQFTWNLQGDSALKLLPEETHRDLQMSTPNGLEMFDLGGNIQIRWNASGTDFAANEQVKLEYSADSGQSWLPIPGADALPCRAGLFTWTNIPLAAGSHYRIRVTSLTVPTVQDASDRDFTVVDLGLLTVRSTPVQVWITGTAGNCTDYNYTVVRGGTVSLTSPSMAGYNFIRWADAGGQTLSTQFTYNFTFGSDATVVAEYQAVAGPRDYYVNDDTADPDEGFAPGNDDNNGLTPQTPKRHIQAVFDYYSDIATIHLAPGIYTENVTITADDPDVTIAGAGAGMTVIDGNGAGSCLTVNSAGNLVLQDLTLQNGSATYGAGMHASGTALTVEQCDFEGNLAINKGGGVYVPSGSIALTDCRFVGNSASSNGGAAYFTNVTVQVIDCTFADNIASAGGAIYAYFGSVDIDGSVFDTNQGSLYGGAAYFQKVTKVILTNTSFNGNTTSSYDAGAVYGDTCDILDFQHNTFSGNTAGRDGGGLYIRSCPQVTIGAQNIVTGNTASRNGGGLWIAGSVSVLRNTIVGNRAGGNGGGIYVSGTGPILANNFVAANKAAKGGGLYLSSGFSGLPTGNTIVANVATSAGGGMYLQSASVSISNSILWQNSAINGAQIASVGATTSMLSYCDIEGGWNGTTNLDTDPAFMRNPNDGGDGWGVGGNDDYGDLHLKVTSPCINVGDPSGDYTGQLDIDGQPRIFGGRIDIGADEFIVFTWDGGGANNLWTTKENWVYDVAPQPGDNLIFPSGAAQLESVNDYPTATVFGSITVSGSGYCFSSGGMSSMSIQVEAGTSLESNSIVTGTLTIGAGATVTITPIPPTRTWDGGSTVNNLWSTKENWVGDVAPSAGDNLVFPAGAQQMENTNDYPSTTVFGSISVTGSGYRFHTCNSSSSNMQLQSGVQVESEKVSTGTLTVGAGSVLTITALSGGTQAQDVLKDVEVASENEQANSVETTAISQTSNVEANSVSSAASYVDTDVVAVPTVIDQALTEEVIASDPASSITVIEQLLPAETIDAASAPASIIMEQSLPEENINVLSVSAPLVVERSLTSGAKNVDPPTSLESVALDTSLLTMIVEKPSARKSNAFINDYLFSRAEQAVLPNRSNANLALDDLPGMTTVVEPEKVRKVWLAVDDAIWDKSISKQAAFSTASVGNAFLGTVRNFVSTQFGIAFYTAKGTVPFLLTQKLGQSPFLQRVLPDDWFDDLFWNDDLGKIEEIRMVNDGCTPHLALVSASKR